MLIEFDLGLDGISNPGVNGSRGATRRTSAGLKIGVMISGLYPVDGGIPEWRRLGWKCCSDVASGVFDQ